MRTLRNLAVLSLMIIALFGASAPGSAAESYDSCAGFIATVPGQMTTQGTLCLRHSLSTSATGIHAIEIQNSNVTIDCNGFKIGNGPAGTNTNSVGIFSEGFANITVRHCTILAFHDGISIDAMVAGDGHLIEDNVLSQNKVNGIVVMGNGVIVRRNRVVDTGAIASFGIQTSGDVLDNVVDGISACFGVGEFESLGIQTQGNGSLVQGNRVRNLTQRGVLPATGISISSGAANEIRDNYAVQGTLTGGTAISCNSAGRARDNV